MTVVPCSWRCQFEFEEIDCTNLALTDHGQRVASLCIKLDLSSTWVETRRKKLRAQRVYRGSPQVIWFPKYKEGLQVSLVIWMRCQGQSESCLWSPDHTSRHVAGVLATEAASSMLPYCWPSNSKQINTSYPVIHRTKLLATFSLGLSVGFSLDGCHHRGGFSSFRPCHCDAESEDVGFSESASSDIVCMS